MNYLSTAKNQISELEKCRKELKYRNDGYGTSDSARKTFQTELAKYYDKISEIFAVVFKANQCQINPTMETNKNNVLFSLTSTGCLKFKTTIFNKHNPDKRDYSIEVKFDNSHITTYGMKSPPEFIINWYKPETEHGDRPYDEALSTFKKEFPKFEKAFYKSIDRKTKQLKKELKKENSNDKKRNNKKAFGCV